MKLGKRNLLYSLILASIMLAFLVGYFVYMLPSLYVDYRMEQNLRAVEEQHRAYASRGSYADVQVQNPTACFSVKIPDEGNSIFFTSKMVSAEVVMRDERLQGLFYEVRQFVRTYSENKNMDLSDRDSMEERLGEQMEKWGEELGDVFAGQAPMPFEIKILTQMDGTGEWRGEYRKIHVVSDDFLVLEMGVEDTNNQYINYIALERREGCLLVTFLPVLTPDMNEIRPVVLQSLPMLGAVILLLVLLFSQVYSRGIVAPIVRLVQHTEEMKGSHSAAVNQSRLPGQELDERNPEGRRTKQMDEIGLLAVTIDELYCRLKASYDQLEEKNEALEEENKRQEVLLRASSHQLKTPISAALLLVDGMHNQIGKYQDTHKYLPQVKQQLLSMKRMVEDILYLNHCGETLDFQQVELVDVLQRKLADYRIAAADRQLEVRVEGAKSAWVYTDETVFSHILDNLLSNAVNYTPEGGKIRIAVEEHRLTIHNSGVLIDEELLPHIFEPFVSGTHDKHAGVNSHGLGLYIASYFAKKIGMQISVENRERGVAATIRFQ